MRGISLAQYNNQTLARRISGAIIGSKKLAKTAKMLTMAKQSKKQSATRKTPSAPGSFQEKPAFSEIPGTMNTPELNLANHFLIAMPSMLDPMFGGTVVYLCEHNAQGALGVVINRPTDMTIDDLFQ